MDHYTLININRNGKKGGGVAIYLPTRFEYLLLNDLTKISNALESIFIEIISHTGINKIIGVIYRPPQSSKDDFLNELQNILQNEKIQNKTSFIMGDFNFNLLNQNSHEFMELFLSFSFLPLVTKPTRVFQTSATLIDNIFTNLQSPILSSSIVVSDISDHYPIFCETSLTNISSHKTSPKIKSRKITSRNLELLNDSLSNIDWQQIYGIDEVDEAYDKFINILTNEFDTHIPLRDISRNYKKQPRSPWINKTILRSINRKNNLYYRYKACQTDLNRTKYTRYKNILTNVLRQAKKQYYSIQFQMNKDNIKNTWKIINSAINKRNKTQNIEKIKNNNNTIIKDPKSIAECFNEYFSCIGKNLAEKIPETATNFRTFLTNPNPNSIFFLPTTREEIIDIVKNMKNKKSSGNDGIDNCLLKSIILYIASPLAHIFNLSLSTGSVPNSIKIAKVIPIFKKGDALETNNYRPISLLPSLSKVLEKLIFTRVTNFLCTNNIICENQFGFRAKHNTTHAILTGIDKIARAIDQRLHTVGIFLDFSKAFDTIDHDILLYKLEHYGVRGKALEWFRNYLENRKQYVELENNLSMPRHINCGVPQGSLLGPLLFIIYLNDFKKSSEILSFILFADDSNLFYSHSNPDLLLSTVNSELRNVLEWVNANKLSLNIPKTNFMIFSNTLRDLPGDVLIDGTPLVKVKSSRFLGITFDDKLNWKSHTINICKTISRNIGIMNKLKYYFPSSTLSTLYFSLVLPYLNYGIMAWGNSSQTHIDKITALQNRALKIIHNAHARDKPDPLFRKSKILKFSDLFHFQTGQFMYQFNKKELPMAFSNMFTKNNSIHNYPTRQANSFHLPLNRTSFASKTVSFYGPKYWNSLAADIKTTPSLNCFKKKLKKHLISKYPEEDKKKKNLRPNLS